MKANKLYIIILILELLVFSACDRTVYLSPDEYIKWVNESEELIKEEKIEPFIYSVKFIPSEFDTAKRIEDDPSVIIIDSLEKEISGYITFIFKISCTDNITVPLRYDANNNEEFSNRLQYCSFGIHNDFILVKGNDTLKCTDSHFIHEYTLRPYNTIILNFEEYNMEENKPVEDLTLVYNDNMWKNGILKFKFRKADLEKIPLLKY